ncbi:MAG: hypothetical protein AB8B62_01920 [Roseobacter sp.]
MKFSAQEILNVPVAEVFAMLTHVETYERAASGRKVTVRRKPDRPALECGAALVIGVKVQELMRDVEVEIKSMEQLQYVQLDLTSGDFTGTASCALTSLCAARTELKCVVAFQPVTLAARLLFQPMKLAKATLDEKYQTALAALAAELEAQHRRSA